MGERDIFSKGDIKGIITYSFSILLMKRYRLFLVSYQKKYIYIRERNILLYTGRVQEV